MLKEKFAISIPNEWLDGKKDDYFLLTVEGDSYTPYYAEDDLLIICKDLSKLDINDVRVYEINGAFELRKYGLSTNGTELLLGLTGYIPKLENVGFKLCGFVYMRITNYRKGAADNGKNEAD